MSRRTKYTAEEKYEILEDYENGTGKLHKMVTKYKITASTLKKWKYNYSKRGING